ncbi:MAG: precorrin-6y C5,15-methyltransferase (decarboxylating) subunit CbiE [Psychrilyobacter sp.]|nr:precorrin-6y C5,15-methyltransferase (decarboxylating) subunit CbiE [Psychrilyobacter sp.]
MKNKINILGLGPGNKEYFLPITQNFIKNSEILIGGKRNIESLGELGEGKQIKYIDKHLEKLVSYIKQNKNKKISLIVSGDPGFYSMVPFMKRYFLVEELNIIPGISSMQYMFSKIGYSYENSDIKSVHGRECDYITPLKLGVKVGLLTDNVNTPQIVAKNLIDNGIRGMIFVGENLSYENEKIISMNLEEMVNIERTFKINVVIVIPSEVKGGN